MPGIATVLFDMDGTLLRLNISNEQMDHARERLRRLFLDAGVDAVFRPVLTVIRNSLSELRRRGVATDTIRGHAYQVLDTMEMEGSRCATPCSGAAEVLTTLRGTGRPLGLITNNGRRCVNDALRASGLPFDVFSTVVTRDDVEFHKPHGDAVLAAATQLGLAPGAVAVVVGDGVDDMKSARAASGVPPLGLSVFTVAVGESIRLTLRGGAELADWYVADLGQIPDIVGALDGQLRRAADARVTSHAQIQENRR